MKKDYLSSMTTCICTLIVILTFGPKLYQYEYDNKLPLGLGVFSVISYIIFLVVKYKKDEEKYHDDVDKRE